MMKDETQCTTRRFGRWTKSIFLIVLNISKSSVIRLFYSSSNLAKKSRDVFPLPKMRSDGVFSVVLITNGAERKSLTRN